MKIAILQFPGSNCERETILAVQRAGMQAVPFLWNEPTAKLDACDGYIIVGGFAYEDRGRAGIIASLDPVMLYLYNANDRGKPILGICNGAQILIESGLVPGLQGHQLAMALAPNRRIKNNHILGAGFYNNWITVKTMQHYPHNAFLCHFQPHQPIRLPVAHAEGRFMLADGLWEKITEKQIAFLQYEDNPNGSEHDLAAICNHQGNVMAIMPHPERTLAGDIIFSSMRNYILEDHYNHHAYSSLLDLDFIAPKTPTANYSISKQSDTSSQTFAFIIELMIQDNTAFSVQKALQHFNYQPQVTRYTHWEVTAIINQSKQQLQEKLVASCELFNPYKEIWKTDFSPANCKQQNNFFLLVQDKDNIIGKYKRDTLHEVFGVTGLLEIKRGDLWCITALTSEIDALKEFILAKHILFNPYSQNGYFYQSIY